MTQNLSEGNRSRSRSLLISLWNCSLVPWPCYNSTTLCASQGRFVHRWIFPTRGSGIAVPVGNVLYYFEGHGDTRLALVPARMQVRDNPDVNILALPALRAFPHPPSSVQPLLRGLLAKVAFDDEPLALEQIQVLSSQGVVGFLLGHVVEPLPQGRLGWQPVDPLGCVEKAAPFYSPTSLKSVRPLQSKPIWI